ncbi:hypothetical protein BOX15_Mlig023844g1 [Macrostomum lignano]|uniref:AAA+ ATPase domain-containing protein n=1 Tax=Macrostomum lignano TaxID=282301 RepID=A0A267EEQ0_9PLAT|nr:hypothetical protein BOX15_Mlig023844g1 [Macrostomum lignano]
MLDKLRFFRDRDRHKASKVQQPAHQQDAAPLPDPLSSAGIGSRKHHTASRSQHHSRSAGRHQIAQPGPYHATEDQQTYGFQHLQQPHHFQKQSSSHYASHIPSAQHSQQQQPPYYQKPQETTQAHRTGSTSSGGSRQLARPSPNLSGGRSNSTGIPQPPPSQPHSQYQQMPKHSIPSKQHKSSRSSRASSSAGTTRSAASSNQTGESLKYSSIPLPTGPPASTEVSGQPQRTSVATQSSRHDRHKARELYNSGGVSQILSDHQKLSQTSVSTSTVSAPSVSRSPAPDSSHFINSAMATTNSKPSSMASSTQLNGPTTSLPMSSAGFSKQRQVSLGRGVSQTVGSEAKQPQVSVGCGTKQLPVPSAETGGRQMVPKAIVSNFAASTSSSSREVRAKSEGVDVIATPPSALKLESGGVQLSERLRERIEKAQLSQQNNFIGSPARLSRPQTSATAGNSPYTYLKLVNSGMAHLVGQQNADASGYASDCDPHMRSSSGYTSDGGYMSESGIGSCARRMQQRFREGMQAVQEYNRKTTDRYAHKSNELDSETDMPEVDGEDSNSVSSGEISDAVAELEKDESLLKTSTSAAPNAASAASAAASIRQQLRQKQQQQQGFVSSFQSMPIGRTLLNRSRVSPSAAAAAAAVSDQYSSTLRRFGALSDAEASDLTDDYGSLNFRRGDAFDRIGGDPSCYFSDTEMIGAVSCNSAGSQQRSMLSRLYPAEQADGIRLTAGQAPAAPPSDLLGSDILSKSARHARSLSASKQLSSPVRDVSPASSLSNIRLPYSPVKSSNSTGCFQQQPHAALATASAEAKETRGSSLSLYSNHSNLSSMSANEERQLYEIQKLRRELEQAHERVSTLTSQLSTNTHVVSAFEHSLGGMTAKLQHLANTAEKKESELNQLRATVEELRRQSLAATAATVQQESSVSPASPDASAKPSKRHWLRESFGKALKSSAAVSRKSKSSASSTGAPASNRGSISDFDEPCSPLTSENPSTSSVSQLKRQLEEKELKLSDLQTEALNSAHQLEQLQNLMGRMKAEMSALKADNSRLQSVFPAAQEQPLPQQQQQKQQQQQQLQQNQQQVSLSKRLSLDSGTASIGSTYSAAGGFDLIFGYSGSEDSKRVTVVVCSADDDSGPAIPIGCLPIGSRTKWETMDAYAKRLFKEYVMRIDPMASLGLNGDSIASYMLGQVTRCRDQPEPDVRPHVCADDPGGLRLLLRSCSTGGHIDSLAFDTLIPKAILQRYISLLLEHRKIILCGPCGTGKTYLAQKLADYIVKREGAPSSAVTMFVVDHKSEKELRSYLNGIADEKSGNEVPLVIILDNLHHVNPLSEVLNSYLNSKSPYIIGTMNQAGCSSERLHAAKLQLHNTCNFRWVLCANHMEPVKGFLGRFLRRKLLNSEVMDRAYKPEAARIVDWIPSVWQHLNKFLETHSSSEVTIGPRQFLSCPVGTEQSQLWFADLWNHSLVPYLLEACREGLQTYGRRAPWEDPTEWIMATWPWEFSPAVDLIRLRPRMSATRPTRLCRSPRLSGSSSQP